MQTNGCIFVLSFYVPLNVESIHYEILLLWGSVVHMDLLSSSIVHHMHSNVWCEIIHPFQNFNGSTVGVCEWMNYFIPHVIINTIFFLIHFVIEIDPCKPMSLILIIMISFLLQCFKWLSMIMALTMFCSCILHCYLNHSTAIYKWLMVRWAQRQQGCLTVDIKENI